MPPLQLTSVFATNVILTAAGCERTTGLLAHVAGQLLASFTFIVYDPAIKLIKVFPGWYEPPLLLEYVIAPVPPLAVTAIAPLLFPLQTVTFVGLIAVTNTCDGWLSVNGFEA